MSTTGSSGSWDVLAQLDHSRVIAAQREAEKGSWHPRATDVEEEDSCRLPLRILQEITGHPVGFERVSSKA